MTDTTNTPRAAQMNAALQQALYAMDVARDAIQPITQAQMKLHRLNPRTDKLLDDAIDAARAALAANPAPEQAVAVRPSRTREMPVQATEAMCFAGGAVAMELYGHLYGQEVLLDVRNVSAIWNAMVAAAPPVAPAQSFLHKPSGMTFDTVIAAVDESAIVELGEPPVAPAPAEPQRLFEFIAHGDERHRVWLRQACHAFYAGEPRPAEAAPAAVPALRDMIQMVLDEARKGGSDEEVIAAVQWRMPAAAVPARTDTPEPLGVAAARPGSPFQPQAASTAIPNAKD